MALAKVDIDTLEIEPFDLKLVQTEKDASKQVRKGSDNYRCGREIMGAMKAWELRATLVAAEIPAGAQSAIAANQLGISLGILCALKDWPIEVSAQQAKVAATGQKIASKAAMIDWATTRWPNLPWLRMGNKSTGRILNDNEHLADALAVICAAVQTPQFNQAATFMRSLKAIA